jgi:hypothetical protein
LDSKHDRRDPFVFPKWANAVRLPLAVGAGLTPVFLFGLLYLAFAPGTSSVGYQPPQPVEYSHALHAGELGIDCRYCHVGVETGASATLPSTSLCMNCHATVRTESPKLALVRESFETGRPIEWVRVHDLPDYAYFDHSAHVRRGVGCESCHGRVDKMDMVHQAEGLNMGWCLGCHRDPDVHIRPLDEVTRMGRLPDPELGRELREARNLNPPVDCATCHR